MNGHTRQGGGPCPICQHDTVQSEDQEYRRCIHCGIVRTRFGYNQKVYGQAYATTYVQYAESPINASLNLFRLGLVSRWLKPKDRILDVGCCIGEFIRFAEHYYECVGYEPNSHAAIKARKRVSSKISGELNGAISKVQCITMFDVLEHVSDPKAFLIYLRDQYLLPGGIIALTTPNAAAIPMWNEELLRKWKHYKPEEHLFLYTELGLEWLFEDVGLKSVHWGLEESDIRPGNPNGDILTCVVRREEWTVSA